MPTRIGSSRLYPQLRGRAIYNENYQVYGARKIWEELHRQGHAVARCTVERLMRRAGIRGVSRGRARRRTTVPDRAAAEARPDLVRRDFTAPARNQRWVADFTYVPISTGTVYAAFIVDCFSRFIVGRRLAGHMRTDLPLDALEMALWRRDVQSGQLVHHSDRGTQYLSIRYTERLVEAGASVLLVVKEIRTTTRSPSCGYRPPAEYEAVYYDQHNVPVAPAGVQ